MNEKTKTLAFVVVALLVVLVVWVTRPSLSGDRQQADMRGKTLFEKFTNADAATSLEIVKYNEATGEVNPFKVAQAGGVWSIPSHENYPADAKDHLAEAATALIGLKVLDTASDNPGDHATFGVVDPTDKDLAPGATGVGMRVTLRDKDQKPLADLVIGKPDGDNPGLRYVRCAGRESVYTVALSTDRLSTDFGDWIEKDLLKLNSWDLSQVFIQDYSIDEVQGHVLLSDEFTLGFDGSADPKWKLLANRRFTKDGTWEDVKLAADEELNTQRLDAMQTALDDLKIVDVARKPAGLSADLAADKTFFDDAEAKASLMERGFYPASVDGKTGIYSNEGETRILMKSGVEYILRFGGIAGSGGAAEKSKDGKQKDSGGVNRYLFVSAQFNPAPIAKPELQPLPSEASKTDAADAKAGEKETEAKKPEDAAATPKPDDAKKPDDGKKPADKEKSEAEKKADLQKQRDEI